MFHYIRVSVIVVVLMTVLFLLTATRASHAASVLVTVVVPNDTTNFGAVLWTLNKPGENPDFFEIGWEDPASLNANAIVTTMETEVDNAFGFEGDVTGEDGNMLFVDNALGNLGTACCDFDMTWEVDLMGGSLPPRLDLPFGVLPQPLMPASLSLFIAGKDGSSVPVESAGIITLQLVLGAREPINATLAFDSSMSTADVNRNLNDVLMGTTLPAGISYEGLNNGFPMFTAEDDFDFSVAIHVSTDPLGSDAGFHVGFVAYGTPEPATLSMLLIGLGCLALLRSHRREASTGGIVTQ